MLKKKMIRDIFKNLSSFIAIFLMILIGVCAYTGIESYMIGMSDSAKDYYKKNNLQDLNIYGKFNNSDLNKIKNMKYVKDAEGKLTLKVDNNTFKNHKLSLNFIDTNNISKLYIVKGDKYNKNKDGLWLDYYYAKNNNIKVGDNITLSYNNIKLKEKVRGLVTVPDHVYEVKDEAELFPTHKDFGFAYLSFKELKNYPVTYNSIMIDCNKKDINKIRNNIEKNISNNIIFTKIEDELSYSNYQGEIDEGNIYVGIFSSLFIFIALLSVVTAMSRIIKKERSQIGILKALGFSNFKITTNYLSYSLFITILASIFGVLAGYYLIGTNFMKMEMAYYEIPIYHAGMSNKTILVILLIIFLVLLTTYLSIRKTLSEDAASILKIERPKVKSNTINFTNNKFFRKLNFSTKWNIRDIFRNKFRTIMGLVGVIGTIALVIAAFGSRDTMKSYLNTELNIINNYKYKLNVSNNISNDRLNELEKKYSSSETIGIEIKKDKEIISNNLFINNTNGNIRLLDNNFNEIKNMKDNGVYITRKLASNYNYKVGDTILWHIYGDNKYYKSKIVGLSFDPQNQNLNASKKYLESLNIKYKPDTMYLDKEINTKHIDGISIIQSINSIKSGIDKMLETINSMILLILFFAILLGVVIIYNMTILSFQEKDYQFATLKVLGFSDKKISKIFIKQNIWITLLGIIIGMPLGYKVVDYIFIKALSNDYDFFANINKSTYIISFIITFILSYLVSYLVSLKIRKIDMVKSLKANE